MPSFFMDSSWTVSAFFHLGQHDSFRSRLRVKLDPDSVTSSYSMAGALPKSGEGTKLTSMSSATVIERMACEISSWSDIYSGVIDLPSRISNNVRITGRNCSTCT
jgi:hypothetical protein